MREKVSLTILMLVLLVACGAPDGLQNYSAQNVTSEDVPSKWSESAFPIQLKISSDFSAEESSAISEMSSKWTSSAKTQTNYFETQNLENSVQTFSDLDAYNDNTMGVYKIYEWDPELPATALAVTQLFGSYEGSKIIIDHADILINYENFEFTSDGGYGYDLETVVLHELGHFLGLYHEYDLPDETVMYPSISRFDIRREPLDFDIQNIQKKYDFSYSEAGQKKLLNSLSETSDHKRIVIRLELNAKGKCTHKINGKVNYEH